MCIDAMTQFIRKSRRDDDEVNGLDSMIMIVCPADETHFDEHR